MRLAITLAAIASLAQLSFTAPLEKASHDHVAISDRNIGTQHISTTHKEHEIKREPEPQRGGQGYSGGYIKREPEPQRGGQGYSGGYIKRKETDIASQLY